MWSAKHHAPTVRWARRGSARRTVRSPTRLLRLSNSSTVFGPAAPWPSTGDASASLIGPLTRPTLPTLRRDSHGARRRRSFEQRGEHSAGFLIVLATARV